MIIQIIVSYNSLFLSFSRWKFGNIVALNTGFRFCFQIQHVDFHNWDFDFNLAYRYLFVPSDILILYNNINYTVLLCCFHRYSKSTSNRFGAAERVD